MKNMKMSKAEKSEMMPAMAEQPDYPHGLMIRLEKEQLEKLGFKSLPEIGTMFELEAMAMVHGVRMGAGKDEEYASLELQITDMELEMGDEMEGADEKKAKVSRAMFGTMYGKE